MFLKKICLQIEIKYFCIPNFSIKNDTKNIYKTYITQEMLKNFFIVYNSVYISICHNEKTFLINFLMF